MRRVAAITSVVIAVVVVAAIAAWSAKTTHDVNVLRSQVAGLRHQVRDVNKVTAALRAQLEGAQAEQPDVSKISDAVGPSVFTVEAGLSLGSSWIARSDQNGADLVTNFHVVEDLWDSGGRTVTVANPNRVLQGTIQSVRPVSDLAMIHVNVQIAALSVNTSRPPIGDPIVVFGSPLGLTGTVTTGIVSAYRTEQGVEYLQFSAPISPGSSGGPVVDHDGRVIGITTAKAGEPGAEGVSFALPSADVCKALPLGC